MNNYEKITGLLAQSDLSAGQAAELLILFEKSDDIELSPIVEILEQDISWAGKIYQNYAAKKDAVESSDNKKWQKIFDEETEMLQNLEKN